MYALPKTAPLFLASLTPVLFFFAAAVFVLNWEAAQWLGESLRFWILYEIAGDLFVTYYLLEFKLYLESACRPLARKPGITIFLLVFFCMLSLLCALLGASWPLAAGAAAVMIPHHVKALWRYTPSDEDSLSLRFGHTFGSLIIGCFAAAILTGCTGNWMPESSETLFFWNAFGGFYFLVRMLLRAR